MAKGEEIRHQIEHIIRQEEALTFTRFDENTAFELGSLIRNIALEEKLGVAIDISLWDRRLFFAATAGTSADNHEWIRRKFNVVRRFHAATYRLVLQHNRDDSMFAPHRGLNVEDYALAGGGFPIRVAGIGAIGAVVVSGLPQREDHNLVVRGLAVFLGLDLAGLALPSA
ncbi:heme-degrading domain-containing protein [Daeguia caeni]|uniref:UPF0303 protein ACFO1V_09205 n=1 Tax=Daeguia caeni TaxID=439612 RepID=A0ABV9H8M1_9HYPH